MVEWSPFEFDAIGSGYVSYRERDAGLVAARGAKTTTLLVFVYHRSRRV